MELSGSHRSRLGPLNRLRNADYWLELTGIVERSDGESLDKRTHVIVQQQLEALNALELDWTRDENNSWLVRNWDAIAKSVLPKLGLLAVFRGYGVTSKNPSDTRLRLLLATTPK